MRLLYWLMVIVAIGIACFLAFIYMMPDDFMQPVVKEETVVFPGTCDTVYIQAKAWGLTGDHELVTVSTHLPKNRASDAATDLLYHQEAFVCYRQKGDSLILYVPARAAVPADFSSAIKLQQVIVPDVLVWYKSKSVDGIKLVSIYQTAE